MKDILKMILSALGATVGAVVILAGTWQILSAAGALLLAGAGMAVALAPLLACLGGVAYAASRKRCGG